MVMKNIHKTANSQEYWRALAVNHIYYSLIHLQMKLCSTMIIDPNVPPNSARIFRRAVGSTDLDKRIDPCRVNHDVCIPSS